MTFEDAFKESCDGWLVNRESKPDRVMPLFNFQADADDLAATDWKRADDVGCNILGWYRDGSPMVGYSLKKKVVSDV